MRLLQSAAALLLIALPSGGSSAATIKPFTILNWAGGAVVNDKTKQFEYCTAASKNDSGITISFSIDRQFAWKLAFSSPSWGFAAGHAFNATIKIGDEEYRGQRAVVTADQTFEMQVGDPIALFERMRTARTLRLQAGGLTLGFDLSSADEVLPALVRCVTQQLPQPRRPASKSAAAPKPLQLVPPADDAASGDPKALAADLLAQLGLSDFRPVASGEFAAAYRADVAWKKGPIVGTVSIVPPDRIPSMDGLAGEILNGNSQTCRERIFLIATSETISQSTVSRVFTSCRTLQGQFSTYYVAVPRAEGGFYLVTVMNTGPEFATSRPAEDLDNKIRAVILGVIARQDSGAPP